MSGQTVEEVLKFQPIVLDSCIPSEAEIFWKAYFIHLQAIEMENRNNRSVQVTGSKRLLSVTDMVLEAAGLAQHSVALWRNSKYGGAQCMIH